MSANVYLWLCLAYFSFQAAMSATLLAGKTDDTVGLRLFRCFALFVEVVMGATAWILLP